MGPILCETRLRLVYGRTWWSSSGRSRCSWSQSCSRSVCNEAPYETKLMFPYETRLMALIIPYETRLMTWTGPGGVHPTDRAAAGPSHARAFPLSDAHPQVIPELQTKPQTPNPKPQTPNPKPQTHPKQKLKPRTQIWNPRIVLLPAPLKTFQTRILASSGIGGDASDIYQAAAMLCARHANGSAVPFEARQVRVLNVAPS